MLSQVIVGAAQAANTNIINTDNIKALLVTLGGIAVIWAGAKITGKAHKVDYAETARITATSIVGIVLMALGAGTIGLVAFGTTILNWLGITGQ